MRKARQRTQACGLSHQVVECLTEDLDDLIQGATEPIGKVFFSQFFPHLFGGIGFGTGRGLVDEVGLGSL